MLNSSVLSVRLKVLRLLHERQLYDNVFQTAGPETEKALDERASFRADHLFHERMLYRQIEVFYHIIFETMTSRETVSREA